MIPRFIIYKALPILLCLFAAQAAFARINISMATTQVLVNGQAIDSTTSLAKIRQVTGADHGRFESWGQLGFWYIYDSAGVAFRWSADSSTLLCITTEHHAVHTPLYRPCKNMGGTLLYLGTPLTVGQNVWTLLRRAAGHVVSIAPDLYSVCVAHDGYDAQITWRDADCSPRHTKDGVAYTMLHKQLLESCVIFLCHRTGLAAQKPLVASGAKGRLYLNGQPAADTLYTEADFVSEANPCETDFLSVRMMGAIESIFNTENRDSLTLLYDYYKAYWPAHNFEVHYGMDDQYTTTLDQSDFNRDGYALMNDGHFQGAVMVFQLNKEFHSGDYNVLDSYAEGLLNAGRPKDAMYEYVFSLGANPDDDYSSRSTYYYSMRHLALVLGRR